MNRFTEIRPRIANDSAKSGLCLMEILEFYYYLCRMNDPKAMADEYVRKWLELEKDQCEAIQSENANAV